MDDQTLVFLIIAIAFLATGLLVAVLAIPMIMRKIKPNRLYGYRTKTSLSHEDLWYPLNALAGKYMLVLGIVFIIAGTILLFLMDQPTISWIIAGIGCGLFIIIMAMTIIQGEKKGKQMAKEKGIEIKPIY